MRACSAPAVSRRARRQGPGAAETTAARSPDAGPRPIEADLLITGGTLIDGTGGPPLADAAVAIRDERIVAAGRADEVTVAEGTRVLEAGGKTILPGFVNAHAHSSELAPGQIRAWTRAGITTVRDLEGPREMMERRRAFEEGADPRLPRLLVAGPMVTVAWGHPIPLYGLDDRVLVVRGPEDARAKINGLLDDGADQIKIAVSGRIEEAGRRAAMSPAARPERVRRNRSGSR